MYMHVCFCILNFYCMCDVYCTVKSPARPPLNVATSQPYSPPPLLLLQSFTSSPLHLFTSSAPQLLTSSPPRLLTSSVTSFNLALSGQDGEAAANPRAKLFSRGRQTTLKEVREGDKGVTDADTVTTFELLGLLRRRRKLGLGPCELSSLVASRQLAESLAKNKQVSES